jgi:hypothetical protein
MKVVTTLSSKDHRLALVRENDAWGELRPSRNGLFEE